MLLRKIILDDFKTYGGRHEIDLVTTPDKPIILCGGTNGAGKTTLFDSISLCLYGRHATESKMTLKQYKQQILKSFHKSQGVTAQEASITLEFDYAHDSQITRYMITRGWQNDNGTPVEDLHISKKSPKDAEYQSLDSVEQSQWQTFVDHLLPSGITKLFFFDGEKIKKIAESGKEDEHIRSSFDTLLGLDLITQLCEDIGLYILRNSDDSDQNILEDIDKKIQEKKDAECKIDELGEKQAYLRSEMEGLQTKLKVLEEKFTKLGGNFAQRRQHLVEQKTSLETRLHEVEKYIRDICTDTLPLSLVPRQMDMLQKELKEDTQKMQSRFEKDILNNSIQDISDNFEKLLEGKIQNDILGKLRCAIQDKIKSLPKSDNLLHNLSLDDNRAMRELIHDIATHDLKEIEEYTVQHDKILAELSRVKSDLDISPQQDEIGPIFSEIKQKSSDLGEMQKELDQLENLEAQQKTIIVLINSRIRQDLAKKKIHSREKIGLNLAPRVQDTLEEYAKEIRLKKISLLEQNILDAIKRLFHKKDFITGIKIDPDTFEIKLYENDEEKTRDMLSKGELQIYSTAIVWGLAKTSGRPLPFVIDTPLARLDLKHRENLVSGFFPHASHQTIILSTDTEITAPYHMALQDYTSKELKISQNNGKTALEDGYFSLEEQIEVR